MMVMLNIQVIMETVVMGMVTGLGRISIKMIGLPSYLRALVAADWENHSFKIHTVSDDFFGSSSRHSLSSPSDSTLIRNTPDVPEAREANII